MTDPFLGVWQMQPEYNDYQFGEPPAEGTYTIEQNSGGYTITMTWVTSDGKDMQTAYHGSPDDIIYPTGLEVGPDGMSMTRADERTLDSRAFIGEVEVAYATRILSEDGNTMTVKQSGKTPDGDDFTNISVYVRQSTG